MLAHILPLFGFMFAASMTPGPNNLLLAASGVRFGFLATIPHMVGVHMGYSALLITVGLGLGAVFERFPALQTGLRIGGTLYVLYLAWRILRSWSVPAKTGEGAAVEDEKNRPIRFVEAFLFQFVNPKGVIMAITVFAAYAVPHAGMVANIALIVGVAAVVNVMSVTTWAGFGAAVQGIAGREPVASVIRWSLALVTVASVATLYL
jgi:threonine/homoserine/homoserine lactone efflux protein